MGNDRDKQRTRKETPPVPHHPPDPDLPTPSASYRRRAWVQFQRALDPLAPIKPLPPPRP
jgi:hypothetical protein